VAEEQLSVARHASTRVICDRQDQFVVGLWRAESQDAFLVVDLGGDPGIPACAPVGEYEQCLVAPACSRTVGGAGDLVGEVMAADWAALRDEPRVGTCRVRAGQAAGVCCGANVVIDGVVSEVEEPAVVVLSPYLAELAA
jgi:hypothetical protein